MEYHQPRTPTFSFNALLRPVPRSSDSSDISSPFSNKTTETDKLLTQVKPKDDTVKLEPNQNTASSCRDSAQQIIITKSDEIDDDVFKKPLSAKNNDPELDGGRDSLLKVESVDIEMLSAKSEDGKQPMSVMITEEKTKENKEPVKEEKNKTISDNTKSLIKAAIKNASFKKRTGKFGLCFNMYMYVYFLMKQEYIWLLQLQGICKQLSRKNFGNKRLCWQSAFSPFSTMLYRGRFVRIVENWTLMNVSQML